MKQTFLQWVVACSFCITIPFLTACSKDDDSSYSREPSSSSSASNITAPKYERDITTTLTDQVDFKVRFSNGGDKNENMQCTLHWAAYSSKPSTTPKARDLTKSESMRQYASTSRSVTFSKSHAGVFRTPYIYYYFECSNSKRTTSTSITYRILKK